jgi:uroporphyrinogen-III synthase
MTQPLRGKKILITRPEGQQQEWADQLKNVGAIPLFFPLIEIVPAVENIESRTAFENISSFDWIILPSANAVKYFFIRVKDHAIQNIGSSFAVTGPKTKKIVEQYGCNVSYMPEEYTGESLAENIPLITNKKILISETDISDGRIRRILEGRGASVIEIPVYQTLLVKDKKADLQQILDQGLDVITFASPSAVAAFEEMKVDKKGALIASIGPVTSRKLEAHGIKPDITAKKYTTEGLTEAIIGHYKILKN